METETPWVKSQWNYSDLNDKTIVFHMPTDGGFVHGWGKLMVRENPDGLLAIEATTDLPGKVSGERIFTRYPLTQIAVDRIKRHPNPRVAEFLLV